MGRPLLVMHQQRALPTFRVRGRWHILPMSDTLARSASHSDGRTSAREASSTMNETTTTLAQCADCGSSMGVRGAISAAGAVTREVYCLNFCGMDPYATSDLYLEHDEAWRVDQYGRLVIDRHDEEVSDLLTIVATIACPDCAADLIHEQGDHWVTNCEHQHHLTSDDVRAFGA